MPLTSAPKVGIFGAGGVAMALGFTGGRGKRRRSAILALLVAWAMTLPGSSLATSAGGSVVCDQTYALCSSAPCLPLPGVPGKALCACEVVDGDNVGNRPCKERARRVNRFGLTELTSAFSLVDVSARALMTCPEGSVWTQCLDAPCVVDPVESTKAACTCELKTSGRGQTYGGDCDTSSCENAFWSAATAAEVQGGIQALVKHGGGEPPQQRTCPSGPGERGGASNP